MHIGRLFRSGVVLAGLTCFAISMLPGCGEEAAPSGGTVKVDPAENEKRAAKIREMYKANPPGKGPGGEMPPRRQVRNRMVRRARCRGRLAPGSGSAPNRRHLSS